MGVNGLLPFLRSRFPASIKAFAGWPAGGACVAVDVPIFAHKFIYTERTFDGLVKRFLRFGAELRQQNVEPIFVFDGKKLQLKNEERAKRSQARDRQAQRQAIKQSQYMEALLAECNVSIAQEAPCSAAPPVFTGIMFPTTKEYASLGLILGENGYKTLTAMYEAEALCALLTRKGTAWAVLTEDTDALAFGATRTVFRFGTANTTVVELTDVLQALQLEQAAFTDLCCLMGTDFGPHVHLIGPVKAYELLRKHGSWSTAFEADRFGWNPQTLASAEVFHARFPSMKEVFDTCAFETQRVEMV